MVKGTDKQEKAVSLLHKTTSHTESFTNFQNPSWSDSWEIFDRNLIGEKKKMDKQKEF